MIRQYERITSAFSGTRVKINYACKALTNINVLKLFRGLGSGLDAVSVQEVSLGLKAGFEPQDILYTPNCVSIEEIEEAVELGVRINIDNIAILEEFGYKYGAKVPVCVRINPHVLAGAITRSPPVISIQNSASPFTRCPMCTASWRPMT